jgi:hypothetical protein
MRAALTTWVVVATYRRRVSLGSDEVKTGGLVMSALSLSSVFYVSSIQWKESDFFNSLYKGSLRSPNQDMKQLRAARHPMSH